ncbi:hypothetical protein F3087_41125 [Nocardia colli]|uniref:Uncharacterized protein n=1 Tax=Nocardia colli TaxID=2545717 RepID=A0A5N0DUS6_9NOCA|nr:hypothetical protein [Nocardia colli]KAA8880513.1 hypothetical protein F3087_41125 [Nocardia colli]
MGTRTNQTARHRLGMAGTVHCVHIPAVAAALAEHRRTWFTALISPARHSFAAMRKRSVVPSVRWVPATAS